MQRRAVKDFHCALLARPSGPVQCSAVHSQSLKCFSLEKPRLLSFIHQTPTTLCSTPTNLPCDVHMKNSSPPTPIQRPDSSSYCAVHNLVNFQKRYFAKVDWKGSVDCDDEGCQRIVFHPIPVTSVTKNCFPPDSTHKCDKE